MADFRIPEYVSLFHFITVLGWHLEGKQSFYIITC